MSIHTDRIVLVFPIAQKNRQAAASLQTLEITDSGRELENLVPLDPTLVNEYADEFNLGNLSKITELEADKTKLTTDLADKTSQYDAEVAKVTALEAGKATLTTEKTQLTADLATDNATIAMLQARIAELEQAVIDLTPPPAPLSITRYQCTTWLRSANVLQPTQSVSDLIRSIVTDPDQQLRALDRWELGTAVLRNDPMIETLGQLLGINADQLDAAFLVASQIQ